MTKIKARELAQMAGIPDTVPDEAIWQFEVLVQMKDRAESGMMNHDKYRRELDSNSKRIKSLEAKCSSLTDALQRVIRLLREHDINYDTKQ